MADKKFKFTVELSEAELLNPKKHHVIAMPMRDLRRVLKVVAEDAIIKTWMLQKSTVESITKKAIETIKSENK